VFACVGWQVTLYDPIWQATPVVLSWDFPLRTYRGFNFNLNIPPCVCVCEQGYQTGYVYLCQADCTGSDSELAPSTGVGSSLTASDRDLAARLGSAHVPSCSVYCCCWSEM